MTLHKNREIFRTLIESTATTFRLEPFKIEKDYYNSLLLNAIFKAEDGLFVFKGGTSLSKCFKIIDRFSEDIDLALAFEADEKVTVGKKKKAKETIVKITEQLGFRLANRENIRSRRDINRYIIEYDSVLMNSNGASDKIIIETITAYRPFPVVVMPVDSLIYKYLSQFAEGQTMIEHYSLDPFSITVQSIERTFIDKIFAICDYHIQKDYDKHSRHIYDLHMLWTSKMLDLELVKSIIPAVLAERNNFPTHNPSAQPGTDIRILLYEATHCIDYRNDFEKITQELVYNVVKYDVCIKSLDEIIAMNILPNVL